MDAARCTCFVSRVKKKPQDSYARGGEPFVRSTCEGWLGSCRHGRLPRWRTNGCRSVHGQTGRPDWVSPPRPNCDCCGTSAVAWVNQSGGRQWQTKIDKVRRGGTDRKWAFLNACWCVMVCVGASRSMETVASGTTGSPNLELRAPPAGKRGCKRDGAHQDRDDCDCNLSEPLGTWEGCKVF
jgi:hypothetical protein